MFKHVLPVLFGAVAVTAMAQSEGGPAPVYDPQGRLIPYDVKPEPTTAAVPPKAAPKAGSKAGQNAGKKKAGKKKAGKKKAGTRKVGSKKPTAKKPKAAAAGKRSTTKSP